MVQHYLFTEIPEVKVSSLNMRQLIQEDQAPRFIMRRYDILPQTTHHFESEKGEREIYLLSGHLDVSGSKKVNRSLSPNDFLYIPPEDTFIVTNKSDHTASFLDILPKPAEVTSNLPFLPPIRNGNYTDIEAKPVIKFGSTYTTIRVLIDEDHAHQMLMRRFEIAPGGTIGVHQHAWEHEMFVLEGKMLLTNLTEQKEEVEAGEFIYMPPNEDHGYRNESSERAVFICMIPNLKYFTL
ncbi:MAG: cupin domain-containing protein [Promethearchaeota archaeon]